MAAVHLSPFVLLDAGVLFHNFVPGHFVEDIDKPGERGEVVGSGDSWVCVEWWYSIEGASEPQAYRGIELEKLRVVGIR